MNKFCQSCGMPMNSEKQLGNEVDGSKNQDYCEYCYKDGNFTSDVDMEGMMDICLPFMIQAGIPEEEAKKQMQDMFPNFKRWKK